MPSEVILNITEVFNQNYSEAASVILRITSEGNYYAAKLNERLNSSAFVEFLKIINSFI